MWRADAGTVDSAGGGMVPDAVAPADACVRKTCRELGIECGLPVDDGCGGSRFCGNCQAGMTCGGHTCGPCVEVAVTCEELGIHCGPAGDGCGGILYCGTCPPARSRAEAEESPGCGGS